MCVCVCAPNNYRNITNFTRDRVQNAYAKIIFQRNDICHSFPIKKNWKSKNEQKFPEMSRMQERAG